MPSTSEKTSRVSVEERLFSLVLALIATEIGLTKADILSTVQGYRQRYVSGGDNASLERQFERDKDDIRELGIPLEVVEPPDDPGSNHHLRYRIPKGLYDLPADVSFTADELMLLKLAATVWREGSLSAESRRAMTKLNALGIDSSDPVLGYSPSLRVREASFEPLSKAMDRGQVVAFLYLKPGESAPRRRQVEPRAVVLFDGRWHLFGTDRDAAANRTFLLSRIVGPVVAVPGGTFVPPGEGQAQEALSELDALWNANLATISVQPGSDAAVRLSKRHSTDSPQSGEGDTTVNLHFTDLNVLADELAGFGPEVLVHAPAALRSAVRARLVSVRDAHTDALTTSTTEEGE
ncbi:helix-turn-helix transcriptional regulator [Cryobacterium cryoconiti]|uniref:WYL domain-containing protein n=1 Tax=Cryobacterium cryoconiti TaxID=1259239 RepID=A0A4Y8JYU4_9MICO|nr:WYL domain-containing protein [Cryobacterium cryoconiti]TFD33309.1 WYL domain-containing protein [Cryobacterium cryoconiti]